MVDKDRTGPPSGIRSEKYWEPLHYGNMNPTNVQCSRLWNITTSGTNAMEIEMSIHPVLQTSLFIVLLPKHIVINHLIITMTENCNPFNVVLFSPSCRHHHSLVHHLVRGMTWCSVGPGLDVTWMMRMSVYLSLTLVQVRGTRGQS